MRERDRNRRRLTALLRREDPGRGAELTAGEVRRLRARMLAEVDTATAPRRGRLPLFAAVAAAVLVATLGLALLRLGGGAGPVDPTGPAASRRAAVDRPPAEPGAVRREPPAATLPSQHRAASSPGEPSAAASTPRGPAAESSRPGPAPAAPVRHSPPASAPAIPESAPAAPGPPAADPSPTRVASASAAPLTTVPESGLAPLAESLAAADPVPAERVRMAARDIGPPVTSPGSRKLELTAPGGTRLIWVLDPQFSL